MCTVSVVTTVPGRPGAVRVRLVCNRDEQRSRAASSAPRLLRLGSRWAAMPIDPDSGGSWIGVNDAGLVACLLNANPVPGGSGPVVGGRPLSRGVIVPLALECGEVEAALARVGELRASEFPPFRLLLLDGRSRAVCESDGRMVKPGPAETPEPALMLTSSGLGDHLVEPSRLALFQRLMGEGPDALAAQDRFHRHRWADRPHLSVLMSRPDARTVSRTCVEMHEGSASISYHRLSENLTPDAETRLGLRFGVQPAHP